MKFKVLTVVKIITHVMVYDSGQDSIVSIVTCYELYSQGIKARWQQDFSMLSRLGPEVQPASCTMGTGSLPWVKWPECGAGL